jgi:hypothetical protein
MSLLFLMLWLTTGFPGHIIRAYGARNYIIIVVIFISAACGIAANHVFYPRRLFRWIPVLRFLVVSPIVLMFLLGTLRGAQDMDNIQYISFDLLSFQTVFSGAGS